jgi:hypothetical protein
MNKSPYDGHPVEDWKAITEDLVKAHPMFGDEIRTMVTAAWNDIFESKIGSRELKIGVDIFPSGQLMGSWLHELVPREFAEAYPTLWRPEKAVTDKDLVFIPDDKFSIEIKTSSSPSDIPGNKSFAQTATTAKKLKDGYYIVVNYEKFEPGKMPGLKKIRFGWLDHSDWQGQSGEGGQGGNVKAIAKKHKLIDL